jgi:hypothetical protein
MVVSRRLGFQKFHVTWRAALADQDSHKPRPLGRSFRFISVYLESTCYRRKAQEQLEIAPSLPCSLALVSPRHEHLRQATSAHHDTDAMNSEGKVYHERFMREAIAMVRHSLPELSAPTSALAFSD